MSEVRCVCEKGQGGRRRSPEEAAWKEGRSQVRRHVVVRDSA